MAGEKRGGFRPGSGRKKTGIKTKHYTVNLPLEVAEEMEKRARMLNKTVNRYLRDLIEAGGQYSNVGTVKVPSGMVAESRDEQIPEDSELLAAEEAWL